MDNILRGYHVNEPTWLVLSFLLIVAVYFKFNRLWSMRNLDVALLVLIAPGLLYVRSQPAAGYVWLFVVSALLLLRVLADGTLVRRPRLEQNMNAAGMLFLCAASFAFLMTKVLIESPPASTVESVRRAHQLLGGDSDATTVVDDAERRDSAPAGPGSSLLAAPFVLSQRVVANRESTSESGTHEFEIVAARTVAILAHLAVIIGLALVGRQVFGDLEIGLAMATLYMLLPCTAYDVGKVNHVLPSALMVWAVWAYRRPAVAGILLGLACGTLFFPIFVLPLWLAFYGRRGALRFGIAVCLSLAVVLGSVLLASDDTQALLRHTLGYIDLSELQFRVAGANPGFWSNYESAYRIPVFVSFLVMLAALTIWPREKNLGHLISHSAATIIGTQFWYTQQGGVYVLWYLPLLLLVLFRPALLQQLVAEPKSLATVRQSRAGAQRRPELISSFRGPMFR